MADDSSEESGTDICRVCRSESTTEKPLFHPCLCRGSIKFVHQDCLTQWLRYSKKEFCELCNHKYTFTPIYHPDMPKRLPVREFAVGLISNLARAVRFWLHYTLVAVAWLGVVPLTACRIYRCLFRGSVNSLVTLPLDMFSTENLLSDCLQGIFIISVTLCAFVSLVWLREQILHGGPVQWNNNNGAEGQQQQQPQQANENNRQQRQNGHQNDQPAGVVAVAGENLPENQQQQQRQDQPPVLDVADAAGAAVGGAAGAPPAPDNVNNMEPAAQDDGNWQPFEWDRAGEELTWERLLGLDGSLVFLEHVFWVISLNALFIVVFAFTPYHVGKLFILALDFLAPYVAATYFERLVTTLLGYLVVGSALFLSQYGLRLLKLRKCQRIIGMCYLVVKVFMLVLMEIGLFPLICGFWLDVCSLLLFSATLKDRVQSFKSSPGTSAFLHWLVGMIYVFYFASFVLLLREVLRPGVLWFLRNLNDPEFNPIQDMIQFPVYRQVRRFVASLIMFGMTIIFVVYYPVRIIMNVSPSVLPYNIHLGSLNSTVYLNIETSLSELSLELLLLQVVLPALLEQSHARHALKLLIKYWCVGVAKMLGLTEYLLPAETTQQRDRNHNLVNNAGGVQQAGQNHEDVVGDNRDNVDAREAPLPALPAPEPVVVDHGGNLGAEHQALLLGGRGSSAFQPYNKPTWFVLRIMALLACLAVSALVSSLICLTVPVMLGRYTIYLLTGHQQIHELYTMACGLYLCWLTVRVCFLFADYVPWGVQAIVASSKFWTLTILKCLAVAVALFGVIPLLFGVLFQLILVAPLRVHIDQSPLFFPWQDWAMGILHCKILCALVMMGPDWRFKRVFDRVYQDGFRNLNVAYIYKELIIPVIATTGLIIAVPYIAANSFAPLFDFEKEDVVVLQRHIYPCLLTVVLLASFLYWQFGQLCALLQRIRNDRYLVGQRLVNYEQRNTVDNEQENNIS